MSPDFGRPAHNHLGNNNYHLGPYQGFIGALHKYHGFVWCPSFDIDVVLPIYFASNLKVGQWISFHCGSDLGRPHVVVPPVVIRDQMETRVERNVPEVRVEAVLTSESTFDGMRILWNAVVGNIVDYHGYIEQRDALRSKHSVWIVRHHRPNHNARWKISIEEKRPTRGEPVTLGSTGASSFGATEHWTWTSTSRRPKRKSRYRTHAQQRRPANLARSSTSPAPSTYVLPMKSPKEDVMAAIVKALQNTSVTNYLRSHDILQFRKLEASKDAYLRAKAAPSS